MFDRSVLMCWICLVSLFLIVLRLLLVEVVICWSRWLVLVRWLSMLVRLLCRCLLVLVRVLIVCFVFLLMDVCMVFVDCR